MLSFDDQDRAKKRAETFDYDTNVRLEPFSPRFARSFKSVDELYDAELYQIFSTCAYLKYEVPAEELLVSYLEKRHGNKHGIPIITNEKEPLSFSSKHYYLFKTQSDKFKKLKVEYGSAAVAYAIVAYLFCVNNALESQASPEYLFNNFDKFKSESKVTDEIFDDLYLKYKADCKENKLIDWATILFELGVDIEPPIAGNPNVFCPFHNDNDPSLNINIEDELWNCYAGCGGGKLPLLASQILGKPWQEIKSDIEQIAADYYKLNPPITRDKILAKPVSLSPQLKTEPLSKDHWAITERRFDYEDLVTTWGFQQTSEGGLYMPWMDGYMVRNSKEVHEATGNKFYIKKGFKRAEHLFGIDHVGYKSSTAPEVSMNPLILVEGALDAVRINWVSVYRSVATVSADMSKQQLQLIRDLKPKELCLAFDNDKAGRLGLLKAANKLKRIPAGEFKVSFIRYDGNYEGYKFHNHNDFGDITDGEELIKLILARQDISELNSYINDYMKEDDIQR